MATGNQMCLPHAPAPASQPAACDDVWAAFGVDGVLVKVTSQHGAGIVYDVPSRCMPRPDVGDSANWPRLYGRQVAHSLGERWYAPGGWKEIDDPGQRAMLARVEQLREPGNPVWRGGGRYRACRPFALGSAQGMHRDRRPGSDHAVARRRCAAYRRAAGRGRPFTVPG